MPGPATQGSRTSLARFNSLFEMHIWRYAGLVAEVRPVSILYLRCPKGISKKVKIRAGFNSLFEMPPTAEEYLDVTEEVAGFNSLFEMRIGDGAIHHQQPGLVSILYLRCRERRNPRPQVSGLCVFQFSI